MKAKRINWDIPSGSKIEYVHPVEFLSAIYLRTKNARRLIEAINIGEHLPPPMLQFNAEGSCVKSNGEHRAMIAMMMELDSIPVVVVDE